MTTACTFCNGTKIEPGYDGCIWCDNTGVKGGLSPANPVTRYTAVQLRFATGALGNAQFVDAKLFDAIEAERNSLKTQLDQCQARRRQFAQEMTERLNVLDERTDTFEHSLARLRHAGMELTGVIDEYRTMPCDSLKVRMFQTADRYRKRLHAKCWNCEDNGVVGYTTGQTPETFEQGEYPCPECQPTEYAAWSKP